MKQTVKVNMTEALRSCSGEQHILKSSLDEDTIAASVFSHLINTASQVFTNRLILGGSHHTNEEDKMKILDSLQTIAKVLDKHYIEDNMDDLYAPDSDEPWWNK